MKRFSRFLLLILCLAVCFNGSWTANDFIYKPSLGARGSTEKNTFDSGLDQVDARLGKQVWVGDPGYGTTFQNAVTAVGSVTCTLHIPAGTHSISADLTVPANITLRLEKGAVFSIATTKTLTINGSVESGAYQIFSCSGTGKVVFGAGAVKEVYPQWWGAAGDGATDDTAALNAATTSGANRVFIPYGTYIISKVGSDATVVNLASNLTISGAGVGKTIIKNAANPEEFWYQLGTTTAIENLVIENIEFDGNVYEGDYDPAKQHRYGIIILSTSGVSNNIIIRNCYFHDQGGDGITIGNNVSNIIIENNFHKDCLRQGICVVGYTNSSNIEIANNYELTPTVGRVVNGNSIHVEPNDTSGNGTSQVRIIGNYCCRGLEVTSASKTQRIYDVVVANNIVQDGYTYLFGINGLTVTGNVLREVNPYNDYLLHLRECEDVTVTGNNITGTDSAGGLWAYLGSSRTIEDGVINNLVISNNVIKIAASTKYGINLNSQNKAKVISNSIIMSYAGTAYNAIYGNQNKGLEIRGNSIDSTPCTAIPISVVATTSYTSYREVATIANNTVRAKSGQYAISVSGVRPVVYDNDIGDSDIQVVSNCQPWKVRQGNGIAHVFANAVPTYGTWKVGDRVYRSDVTAGGTEGWVFTSAGAAASGAWSDATTYYKGDCVTNSSHYFESKTNANLNNSPTIGGDTYWTDLGTTGAVYKTLGAVGS
jgi:hypothetical protein